MNSGRTSQPWEQGNSRKSKHLETTRGFIDLCDINISNIHIGKERKLKCKEQQREKFWSQNNTRRLRKALRCTRGVHFSEEFTSQHSACSLQGLNSNSVSLWDLCTHLSHLLHDTGWQCSVKHTVLPWEQARVTSATLISEAAVRHSYACFVQKSTCNMLWQYSRATKITKLAFFTPKKAEVSTTVGSCQFSWAHVGIKKWYIASCCTNTSQFLTVSVQLPAL